MAKLTKADWEKAQDLYRQVFVIVGSVNETEKTLSRVKDEANELLEKLKSIVETKVENGNEA